MFKPTKINILVNLGILVKSFCCFLYNALWPLKTFLPVLIWLFLQLPHIYNVFKNKVATQYTEKHQFFKINAVKFKGSTDIRVIPQGTIDNNLGPDRLVGPKALDPNYCRQPTLWLHDLCLEVLTVHGTDLRMFGAKAFLLLIILILRIWHSSSRYNFECL